MLNAVTFSLHSAQAKKKKKSKFLDIFRFAVPRLHCSIHQRSRDVHVSMMFKAQNDGGVGSNKKWGWWTICELYVNYMWTIYLVGNPRFQNQAGFFRDASSWPTQRSGLDLSGGMGRPFHVSGFGRNGDCSWGTKAEKMGKRRNGLQKPRFFWGFWKTPCFPYPKTPIPDQGCFPRHTCHWSDVMPYFRWFPWPRVAKRIRDWSFRTEYVQ